MADQIPPTTMTPAFADFLPDWVARQRWYTAKGRRPQLQRIGGLRWQDPEAEVGIETWLVVDSSGEGRTVYQVPLTYRSEPLPGADDALVATAEHSELGRRYVYDAPHDPAYVRAVMRLVLSGATVTSDGPAGTGEARGVPQRDVDLTRLGAVVSSRVMRGEQSNTSVVLDLETTDGRPPISLILKLFRVLSDGLNPDVVVQGALADAGSTLVPRPVGHVIGSWTADGGTAEGHLVFVQELIPGARDAWREAVEAVAAGEDFSERARQLGAVTARVHSTLAEALPTAELDERAVADLADGLAGRLDWAVRQVPQLASYEPAARAVLESVRHLGDRPALQRVHGDLHLGQVLDGGARGWVVIDFEGEPLRPLADRNRPDLALRDVAGMLRSFDYAAGHLLVGGDPSDTATATRATQWAEACRDAFCAGYADVAGHDPRDSATLLPALELDKALYEAAYEAGNRPSWLPIPLAAVERLLRSERSTEPSTESPIEKERPPMSQPDAGPTGATSATGSTPRTPQVRPVPPGELEMLVHGSHGNPHEILGLHPHDGGLTLRALRPYAREVVGRAPRRLAHAAGPRVRRRLRGRRARHRGRRLPPRRHLRRSRGHDHVPQ